MSCPLLKICTKKERRCHVVARNLSSLECTMYGSSRKAQAGRLRWHATSWNATKPLATSRNATKTSPECAHWMGGERARNLSGARRFRALLAHLALLDSGTARHFPRRPAPKPRWVKDTALESCCLAESLESLIFIQNIDHLTTGKSKVSFRSRGNCSPGSMAKRCFISL